MGRLPLILSATALVVAVLGVTPIGGAVGDALAPGSVGTRQLENSAVTAPKLAVNAVGTKKVVDGGIRAVDLGKNSVTGATVADGSLAAVDLAAGTIPPAAVITLRRAQRDISGAGLFEIQVACQEGERVVGGGGGFISRTTDSFLGNDFSGSLINNAPANGASAAKDQGTPTNWYVQARNAGGNKRLVGFAYCAR